MGQETDESYKWEESFARDINYHSNSPSIDIRVEMSSKNIEYSSSSASSICSENSNLSFDSGLEKSSSDNNNHNIIDTSNIKDIYKKLNNKNKLIKRKISTESDASTIDSTNSSFDDDQQIYHDDSSIIEDEFDDIIGKIGELKLAKIHCSTVENYYDEKNDEVNNDNNEDEDNDDDDDDLRERGPVRPQTNHQRQKPYYGNTENWYENINQDEQVYPTDIDSTAKEILSNSRYSYVINASLDKLVDCNQNQKNLTNNEWSTGNNLVSQSNNKINEVSNSAVAFDGERSLIDILDGLQPAQTDTMNYPNPSPSTSLENWPDSPASSYQTLTSNSYSCTSSCPQSPGSLVNLGSPNLSISLSGSPPRQRQLNNNNYYYRTRPQSSSSSSNYSFGDTPSPLNYQNSIDNTIDEQLGMNFGNFSTWCESCESSGTIVNSSDAINNKLQFANEIINNDNDDNNRYTKYPWDMKFSRQINIDKYEDTSNYVKNNLPTTTVDNYNNEIINNTMQNNIVNPEYNNYTYNSLNELENLISNQVTDSAGIIIDLETKMEDIISSNYLQSITTSQYNIRQNTGSLCNENCQNSYDQNNVSVLSDIWDKKQEQQQQQQQQQLQWNDKNQQSFNDFQIPRPISQNKITTKSKRKNSLRIPNPWKSLSMPNILSSEILKSKLDPNEVERAMKCLLKKTNEELSMGDEDGDTMLMCLVGNPIELEKKKNYLVPLVDRLSVTNDGLTKINKRGKNALYLAAINCPDMYYVAGYIAGVMLEKGIDIGLPDQSRGNTLIHELAKCGESHKSVLSELLALKTQHGNSVFDLSKCNYEGKTPLHIAVESHNPLETGINSIKIAHLLIKNGADLRIKEFKCGNTALHLAVSSSCDPALVQVLLDGGGCDAVNISNRNNNTPLHMIAALSEEKISLNIQSDICLQFIRAGGRTNVQNNQGQLPLTLVSSTRKEFIKKIFYAKS